MGRPGGNPHGPQLIFDRKVRWRWAESTEHLQGEWRCNYPSLCEHASIVQKQILEEGEAKGWMGWTTVREAMIEYGDNLEIAATGAIVKKGKE